MTIYCLGSEMTPVGKIKGITEVGMMKVKTNIPGIITFSITF